MSGRRCRALKRSYIEKNGAAPSVVPGWDGMVSEWRRLKKRYMAFRRWARR